MAAPRERSLGVPQFLLVIVVAVVVILGWDLNRRVIETRRLMDTNAQADALIAQLENENGALKQMKQDVSSDEWVEYECRVLLRCARENETIFVPISEPTPALAPVPASAVAPPPAPKPFWRSWLDSVSDLIFPAP